MVHVGDVLLRDAEDLGHLHLGDLVLFSQSGNALPEQLIKFCVVVGHDFIQKVINNNRQDYTSLF